MQTLPSNLHQHTKSAPLGAIDITILARTYPQYLEVTSAREGLGLQFAMTPYM